MEEQPISDGARVPVLTLHMAYEDNFTKSGQVEDHHFNSCIPIILYRLINRFLPQPYWSYIAINRNQIWSTIKNTLISSS